jgi:thioredoxin-like negative regulator of GroEL
MAPRALRALLLARASGAPESHDYEDDAEQEGAVAVLTQSNFDATLAQHKHALIEFYAPWCGVRATLRPRHPGPKASETLRCVARA